MFGPVSVCLLTDRVSPVDQRQWGADLHTECDNKATVLTPLELLFLDKTNCCAMETTGMRLPLDLSQKQINTGTAV